MTDKELKKEAKLVIRASKWGKEIQTMRCKLALQWAFNEGKNVGREEAREKGGAECAAELRRLQAEYLKKRKRK